MGEREKRLLVPFCLVTSRRKEKLLFPMLIIFKSTIKFEKKSALGDPCSAH